jgi:hypothetical protein
LLNSSHSRVKVSGYSNSPRPLDGYVQSIHAKKLGYLYPHLSAFFCQADLEEREGIHQAQGRRMSIMLLIQSPLRHLNTLCFLHRKRKEKCEMKKTPKQIQIHSISNMKLAENNRELTGKY